MTGSTEEAKSSFPMTTYDDEIIDSLSDRIAKGDVEVIEGLAACFERLENLLGVPSIYNDIYEIPGVIVTDICNSKDPSDEYMSFLFAHAQSSEYIYCGDGATQYAYRIRRGIEAFVTVIASIPQHHYFMAVDNSFVVFFAFENCMVFVDIDRVT